MIGDFNIRNSSWNPNFLYYSIYRDTLINIVDSLNLKLSKPINCVLTRYSDNQQDSNSVTNLILFRSESSKHNSYFIYLEWRLILDYISLTVNIAIFEKHVQTKKHTIVKDNKEEENFINKLINTIKRLSMENILLKAFEYIMHTFANHTEKNC